jgi:copper chaperone CopZ
MSTQNVTLAVSGMHCGGCVKRVERALGGTQGVASVKVDLLAGKAVVAYDPGAVTETVLKEAVRQLGFRCA